MIKDSYTNTIYFSDILASEKYKAFFNKLIKVIVSSDISWGLVRKTKDIWVRDYMPIQVRKDKFVQFRYEPAYLTKNKRYSVLITNPLPVCSFLGIVPDISSINIDGGNIVGHDNVVIMTDRIFNENPSIPPKKLLKNIENCLEIEKLIIIPALPEDPFGHSDGVVRFLNDKTVLINDFKGKDVAYLEECQKRLKKEGINTISVPYNPYKNKTLFDATGIYI